MTTIQAEAKEQTRPIVVLTLSYGMMYVAQMLMFMFELFADSRCALTSHLDTRVVNVSYCIFYKRLMKLTKTFLFLCLMYELML